MNKWLLVLLLALPLAACVGQKEEPEDEGPNPGNYVPGGSETGTVFYRRVLALGFTATWCQYCPLMSQAIADASALRPDRIIPLSVHYMDELSPEEATPLSEAFGIFDYPSLIMDWNASLLSGGKDADYLVSYVDDALKTQPCGLAASAAVTDGTLSLEVKVKAVRNASYSVFAAWAQDDITVSQQAGYGPGYHCQAVLRGFLSPGTGGKDLGALQGGAEATASFSAPAREDGSYLVICALEDGVACNALKLAQNETNKYTYEKEN